VQVVVHDAEAADGYGEDIRKFFQSLFDPLFTADVALGFAESALGGSSTHTRRTQRVMSAFGGSSTIPARNRDVDQMSASDRHGAVLRLLRFGANRIPNRR
jgi:hypothetical protein